MLVDELVAKLMPYITLDDILSDYEEGKLELTMEQYAFFCMEYYDRHMERKNRLEEQGATLIGEHVLIESDRPEGT